MKLKLLSIGIAALALLPIASTAVTQTANAATVNQPVAHTQTVKPSTFAIFNISGQATTSRNAFIYAYDVHSGAITPELGVLLRKDVTFEFDKIAYSNTGHYLYHDVGENGEYSWIDANDCY